MSHKMLIDASHSEETRVVIIEGKKVEDFDFESLRKTQLSGNIYLAKVTRVEPSLQAAFLDYGGKELHQQIKKLSINLIYLTEPALFTLPFILARTCKFW